MKKKNLFLIINSVLFFVFIFSLLSCSSSRPYQSNPLNHTYITSTQEAHSLSGINFKHEVIFHRRQNPTSLSEVNGVEKLIVLIDGRETIKTGIEHTLMGLGTLVRKKDLGFIQLPPGEHKISILGKLDNMKDAYLGRGYNLISDGTITLEKGEILEAKLVQRLHYVYKGSYRMKVPDFEGVFFNTEK